jgi:MscS family membrane protein
MNQLWKNNWVMGLAKGVIPVVFYFFCSVAVKSKGWEFFRRWAEVSLPWNRIFPPALKLLFLCLGLFYCIDSWGIEFFRKWIKVSLPWNKIFFPAVKILFLFLGLLYCIDVASEYAGILHVKKYTTILRHGSIVLGISWILYRLKQEFFRRRFPKWHILGKTISILLAVITSFMTLRAFHLDILPLLAFGGIGAAAVGFSARDIIGSFFGGLMLSVTRPFIVGDLLFIPDRGIEGVVEEIGWCWTLLRDKDRRVVYLPNTLFSQLLIINLTQRSGRRILEVFRIRYSDFPKLPALFVKVRAFLEQVSSIDKEAPILVFISEIAPSSVGFTIDLYTNISSFADYVLVKEEVLKRVFEIIVNEGAQMAHPSSVGE